MTSTRRRGRTGERPRVAAAALRSQSPELAPRLAALRRQPGGIPGGGGWHVNSCGPCERRARPADRDYEMLAGVLERVFWALRPL